MEKKRTTVRVGGRDYPLVSSDSPEHLNRVAAYVDRQITETTFATRMPRDTVAVLVAMNIADELMKAQDECSRLRRELNALREAQK
jgi:cell division protein ZapA